MERRPLVSVIILNWNGREIIDSCVASVLESDYVNLEAIVVDNMSSDGSVELLRGRFGHDKRMRVILTEANVPSVVANNLGMKNARGEYIFLINNDVQVDRGCIRELLLVAANSNAACTPKSMLPSGKIDFIGGLMDVMGYAYGRGYSQSDRGQHDNQRFFFAGFPLFKRSLLNETGYLNEDLCFGWDDVEFSWRIRLSGHKIMLVPTAIIYHLGSHTLKKLRTRYFSLYNTRKNRMAGLIINYNLYNLTRFLPLLLFFYSLVFLKEAILDRNIKLAFSSPLAILWNVKNLSALLRSRAAVQTDVRRVPDREVLRYMNRSPIILEYFLKGNLKTL